MQSSIVVLSSKLLKLVSTISEFSTVLEREPCLKAYGRISGLFKSRGGFLYITTVDK